MCFSCGLLSPFYFLSVVVAVNLTVVVNPTQRDQSMAFAFEKPKGDPPVAPTPVNGPRARSLGSFIAGYKSMVTKRINRTEPAVGATGGSPVVGAGQTIWQRNYHDHIVRNDCELTKIRQYITDNPRYWETDDHHMPQDKREI